MSSIPSINKSDEAAITFCKQLVSAGQTKLTKSPSKFRTWVPYTYPHK